MPYRQPQPRPWHPFVRQSDGENIDDPVVINRWLDSITRKELYDVLMADQQAMEAMRPYYAAIRDRHNGYDPEMRAKVPGLREPLTPGQAIDDLLREEAAVTQAESKVVIDKLVAALKTVRGIIGAYEGMPAHVYIDQLVRIKHVADLAVTGHDLPPEVDVLASSPRTGDGVPVTIGSTVYYANTKMVITGLRQDVHGTYAGFDPTGVIKPDVPVTQCFSKPDTAPPPPMPPTHK